MIDVCDVELVAVLRARRDGGSTWLGWHDGELVCGRTLLEPTHDVYETTAGHRVSSVWSGEMVVTDATA